MWDELRGRKLPAVPMTDETSEQPTHLDARGRARMVDVSDKEAALRSATARAFLELRPDVRAKILGGELAKGEALAVARIAGIQAAKETARLIPLCHPLALSSAQVEIEPDGDARLRIEATVQCTGPTGVEMEAMTAVTVTALTLYDMAKALQRDMRIGPIELCEKRGGRSGVWRREER